MLRLKHILIMLLLLNHSLMFGVTEAAHFPDEQHPYGHAVDYHEHSEDNVHEPGHDVECHGLHIHLNGDLPSNPDFTLPRPGSLLLTSGVSWHQNLAYTPPVPPPDA